MSEIAYLFGASLSVLGALFSIALYTVVVWYMTAFLYKQVDGVAEGSKVNKLKFSSVLALVVWALWELKYNSGAGALYPAMFYIAIVALWPKKEIEAIPMPKGEVLMVEDFKPGLSSMEVVRMQQANKLSAEFYARTNNEPLNQKYDGRS